MRHAEQILLADALIRFLRDNLTSPLCLQRALTDELLSLMSFSQRAIHEPA
jgi:hypothetical protein